MVRLNIELTEELQRKLEARAAETGHATPEQYVRELLAADLGADQELGASLTSTSGQPEERIEAMLLEGLDSGPAKEMTRADWDEVRSEVRRRSQRRKAQ